jgi:putative methyltransferase (TIGR04325 family)
MNCLKPWLPPELLRIARHMLGHGGHFRGSYANWQEASGHTSGYDAQNILKRVLEATRTVRNGKAAYERDGVLFAQPNDPYPLIAALMHAATFANGSLRVLDFGGALGSSYFQCRHWLNHLPTMDWCVVEQPHFVAMGNEQLANHHLRFVESIAQTASQPFDVALFSGVLQYLPTPMEILRQAIAAKPRYIIIDRTPTINATHDQIRIQKQTSRRLAPSSYPIHLFTQATLMQVATWGYRLLSRFDAVDEPMGGIGSRVDFKGYIFEREDV